MAQAAYCSECKENVYVAPDGKCPKGHDAECLSNHYETEVSEQPQAQEPVTVPGAPPMGVPPKKKSKTGLIVGLILAVILLCGIGGTFATCSFINGLEDELTETTFEDVLDEVADEIDSMGVMAPDTSPALEAGVVRITLGWDEAIDMDLEIWDEDGIEAITSAGATNEDVTDGTQSREYFDFVEYDGGDMSTGDYVISVYFAEEYNSVDSAYATLTVTHANGDITQRIGPVWWEEGQDQWHAFRINAETGDIEDIDEFIETE